MKYGKFDFLKTLSRPDVLENYSRSFTNLASNQSAFGKHRNYPYTFPLYKAIAEYCGIGINNVCITRGAEEGLKYVFNTFAQPNTFTLRPNPTFGLIPFYEDLNHVIPIKIDYNADFELSFEEIEESIENNHDTISLMYFATPDNPTGQILPENYIENIILLANKYNIKVLFDITYHEFYSSFNKNLFYLAQDNDNIIIVGSLSKSHGMAGERIGFIISSEENTRVLRVHRPVNEVTATAVKEGIRSLKSKIATKNMRHAAYWKIKFKAAFEKNYIHTSANFIILRFNSYTKYNHYYYHSILLRKGILTRIEFDHECMKNVLRISIGNNKEMKKVLRIMTR